MPTLLPWRLSLAARLWLIVATAILLCGGLIAVNAQSDQHRDRARAAQEIEQHATRTAHYVGPDLQPDNDTEGTLGNVASQLDARPLATSCLRTLAGLQSAVAFGYLEVVDATGKVVCSPKAGHQKGLPWAATTQLLTAIADRVTSTDAPVTDPYSHDISMFTAVPLKTPRPASLIYVTGTQQSLVPEDPDTTFESLLVDTRSMTVLMRYPFLKGAAGSSLSVGMRPVVGTNEVITATGVDGVRRLYRSVPIGKSPFRLLVGESESKAYAGAQDAVLRNLLVGSFLVLVLVVLGLLLHRQIARPTKRLQAAIEKAGRGVDVAAPEDGPSELAALGSAFNTMLQARRSYEATLAFQALHDSLTTLPNRANLTAVLEGFIGSGTPCAAAFLDLDRFKLVNDSHGHEVGDQLLKGLGERLAAAVRPGDVVGRFGGDEFVVVVPGVSDDAAALELAERIRAALAAPLLVAHRELFVSGSVGVAVHRPGEDAEAVLRNADTAMYRAKAHGRNCAAVFDAAMRESAVALLRTQSDLHRALERDELTVLYQPKVDLEDGTVLGAEALVRWRHPERGLISPLDFIPVAEETGLVVPIGGWVLREACSWAVRATERQGRPVTVAVNVSSLQLAQPDFAEVVADALTTTGLAPQQLCLEVTESMLVEDPTVAHASLAGLRAHGVRVALDDFGTGWSSLTYLQQLPVDEIKLDRSFVNKVTEDPTAATIVASLIGMAEAMGLSITAEGIETAEQLAFLRRHGNLDGQGYLFSRPVPPAEIEALLTSGIALPARQGRMDV
jgi:diguanylate cyclase (GGDEF)-like protein